jgi:hypothetical protein
VAIPPGYGTPEHGQNAAGDLQGVVGGATIRQADDKLIAADPRYQLHRALFRPYTLDNNLHHFITGIMVVVVIDRLEFIQV